MKQKNSNYTCLSCGGEFSKWLGKCPDCNDWNSIVEKTHVNPRASSGNIIQLSSVGFSTVKRIITGINEFDLVCGGGIVPGSVILIGGEPGIGKSTLALQIARSFKSLYVSGEESPVQLRYRAERLGIDCDKITVSTNTVVESIIDVLRSDKYECAIIDSVQTLYVSNLPGVTGSTSQIREATARLVDAAKKTSIPIFLIGHITKDGMIAGPKENIVPQVRRR